MSYKVEDTAEVWKSIKGFEGLYEVSNLGRVRSVSRTIEANTKYGHTALWNKRGIVLVQNNARGGYKTIVLKRRNESKTCFVHRLVAEAFIPNPNNLPIINHKDENPSNNRWDNLEWCTRSYNRTYGNCNDKIRECLNKPVSQFDKQGNHIADYDSYKEAEEKTGISATSIGFVVSQHKFRSHNGKFYTTKTAGGFVWRERYK